MWTLVKRLWTDDDLVLRLGRGAIASLGMAAAQGVLPLGKLGWYGAPLAFFLANAYGSKPNGSK